MVTKLPVAFPFDIFMFESCVVLDGDKTRSVHAHQGGRFESCVVLDGDKTFCACTFLPPVFESCVVLDGGKTGAGRLASPSGLRVVLF